MALGEDPHPVIVWLALEGVAVRLDALDRLRDQLVAAQHRVDVDLGLGAKACDGGAADMVDVLDHVADDRMIFASALRTAQARRDRSRRLLLRSCRWSGDSGTGRYD